MNNLVLALLVLSGHILPSILLGIALVYASCERRTYPPRRRDGLPLGKVMQTRAPPVATMAIQRHGCFACLCTTLPWHWRRLRAGISSP